MDVVVAGGHGKMGLRLLRLLAERGHRARGLIRNPDHALDLEDVGAEPVLCDIEELDDIVRAAAQRRRRGRVRRGRRAGQRPGAQADGRLRRRGEADRGRSANGRRPLRDGQRDPGRPPGAVAGEQMRPYYEAKRDADEALVRERARPTRSCAPARSRDDPGRAEARVEIGVSVLELGGEIPARRRGRDAGGSLSRCGDRPSTAIGGWRFERCVRAGDDALRSRGRPSQPAPDL